MITDNKTSNSSVYIIAEAGVNHNGSIDLAKQLVDIAADAGADKSRISENQYSRRGITA